MPCFPLNNDNLALTTCFMALTPETTYMEQPDPARSRMPFPNPFQRFGLVGLKAVVESARELHLSISDMLLRYTFPSCFIHSRM